MKLPLFTALLALVWLGFGLSLLKSILLIFAICICTGGWRFARVFIKTLPRDVRAAIVLVKFKLRMKKYKNDNVGIPTLFRETCDKYPDKVCFISEGQNWTFREVDNYSNKLANYFMSEGFTAGDCVAVFMENSAEYVAVWIGLAKVGIVPALINFNLRMESLKHCLETANVKAIVYGKELTAAITEAEHTLDNALSYYFIGGRDGGGPGKSLSDTLKDISSARPPLLKYNFHGPLLYIYTSGTTGLPKAAKVVHCRYYYMAAAMREFHAITAADVVYDILPLYHTAGGILGIGQALIGGSTVVIQRKFSASRFWSDCVRYNCTVVQYIGEICRYLLAQPIRPEESQHKVRLAFGNGLRPQIWTEFQKRFNIAKIGEFYGATEGNASAVNIDNTVGSVGFTSVILPSVYPISIIKVDEQTGQPIRGENGLCVKSLPGETGELIGKIVKGDPLRQFDGYSSRSATNKKVINDVFTKGDSYFLTGDVLIMDECGYLYFRDRTGDTFRWKGENVSTAEVEATVSNKVDKRDAVCYGVEIPGLEGRAGMVAIEDPDFTIDLHTLYKDLQIALPAYARPVFIRLLSQVDKTGTFKLKKVQLRNEGYNPSNIKDKLFFMNAKLGDYEKITPSVYNDIVAGRLRL